MDKSSNLISVNQSHLSPTKFVNISLPAGSADRSNQRCAGHLPRRLDKMLLRPAGPVLGRIHRTIDCGGLAGVYPIAAGKGRCGMVRPRSGLLGVQYRCFRKSGK